VAGEYVQLFFRGWRRRLATLHADGTSLRGHGLWPQVLGQPKVHGPWYFCCGHLHGASQRLAEIGGLETRGPLGQRVKQRLVIDVHLQRPVAHALWCLSGKR
jgi:hypothetical protein